MSLVALTNGLDGSRVANAVPRRSAGSVRRAAAARAYSAPAGAARAAVGPRGVPLPVSRSRTGRPCANSRRPTRRSRRWPCSGSCPTRSWSATAGRATAATRTWPSRAGVPTRTRTTPVSSAILKDVTSGRVWSAAHQPVCAPADWYRAVLATDRVTFHRADGAIETRTEIAIVPAGLGRSAARNGDQQCSETREVELTSYGEVVLAPPDAERAHPAFANLFVETELHAWCNAITATRRPRSATERSLVCVHVVATGKERVGAVSCETDRARFLGRGRSTRDPLALDRDGALSEPRAPCSIRFSRCARAYVWTPASPPVVAFTTLIAETRERPSRWPTATTIRTRHSVRSIWPGPPRRSNCAS